MKRSAAAFDSPALEKVVFGVNLPVSGRSKVLVFATFMVISTSALFFIEKAAYHAGYGSIIIGTQMLFTGRSEDEDPFPDVRHSCRIPQMDPWDPSIREFVKRPKAFSCKYPPPLTHLQPPTPPPSPDDHASAPRPSSSTPAPFRLPRPRIKIDDDLKSKYGRSKEGELKCCAGAVRRGRVVSAEDKRADGSYSVRESVHGRGCWPNNKYVFDKCPFIWKNFSEKGYVTMFGEDEPSISIFNYHKLGFRDQPTDHYLRPFYVVAEKRLQKTTWEKATWCYTNKDTFTRLIEYFRSFVDTYARKVPFFALMFITGISHENAANIELADARLADFIHHVVKTSEDGRGEDGGLFLALFSDHGMRWGSLRNSPLGWMEERLPFLFIRPPHSSPEDRDQGRNSSAHRTYPTLQANGYRLTSPFDFHETLSALLHGSEERPTGSTCSQCFDLLHEEVPDNRSCSEAAIPEKWCACAAEETAVVDNATAAQGVSLAVDHLNDVLKGDAVCSQLSIGQIMSTTLRSLPTTTKGKRLKFLVTVFTTVPSEAVFEATVYLKDGGELQVSSDISRLNAYGNESWCIDDPYKKPYCYCI